MLSVMWEQKLHFLVHEYFHASRHVQTRPMEPDTTRPMQPDTACPDTSQAVKGYVLLLLFLAI